METRRLSQREWEYQVKSALRTHEQKKIKMRNTKYHYYEDVIGQIMPLPYILGGAAVIALLVIYGVGEFFKFFLSWTVSLTIISTLAFHVFKRLEKEI